MKTFSIISSSLLSLALAVGCNGAGSGTPDVGNGDGNGTDTGTAQQGVAAVRTALNLGSDPVEIEDAMEKIDDLIYEQAWTAESEDRVADAVEPLLRAEHYFRVTVPEKEAHQQDAKFKRWMEQAADHCASGAEAAHAADRAKLTAAFEKIDQACASCHKVYRKKKK